MDCLWLEATFLHIYCTWAHIDYSNSDSSTCTGPKNLCDWDMWSPVILTSEEDHLGTGCDSRYKEKTLTRRRSSSLETNTWLNRHMEAWWEREEGTEESKEETEGQRWSKWHIYSQEERERECITLSGSIRPSVITLLKTMCERSVVDVPDTRLET